MNFTARVTQLQFPRDWIETSSNLLQFKLYDKVSHNLLSSTDRILIIYDRVGISLAWKSQTCF